MTKRNRRTIDAALRAKIESSRDLDVQYKTAFVTAHKLREAMGNEGNVRTLSGAVEVAGGCFGGEFR